MIMILLFTLTTFAKDGYKLDMNIMLNNKLISKPKIITAKDSIATVTIEDSEFESIRTIKITPTEMIHDNIKGIMLSLEIQDETQQVISRPKVLIKEGGIASIEVEDDYNEKMAIKVMATKTQL